MSELKGLARAAELSRNRSKRVEELKKEGKKIFGYICCFAPPEIMHAAGIVPYRITGIPGDTTSEVDSHLEPYGCSYVRNCYAQEMKGHLKFLDGLVVSHSCDMVQRLYGIWTYYRPLDYSRLVNYPHQLFTWSQDFYKRELIFFKESLEEYTGKKISEDMIRESIAVFNRNRALIRELYRMRGGDKPTLRSSELMDILVAGGVLPAEEFGELLEEIIEEVKNRPELEPTRARIMVWGCIIDDPTFYRFIEEAGAQVVSDDTCIGTRTWNQDVPDLEDPYQALKEHYLVNFECPRTDRGPGCERFDYIVDLAKKFKANGVVGYTIAFCDPHQLDYPDLRDYLKEKGLPMLQIDDNYSFQPEGAIKTRIQAFVELLE